MVDDDVHRGVVVHTMREDDPRVQARLEHYREVITADEQRRAERFVQPGDRARFIVGRALARTMLSACGPGMSPREWPIVIDSHGRPVLGRLPSGTPDLRFNLSHTSGLVCCALTVGREVGVDVECISRHLTHDVADRFFAEREVRNLRALPLDQQPVVFFDYWTLKESYIKARGLGLAIPLDQFAFVRSDTAAPTIEFSPALDDDPTTWQFAQFWPTDTHRMAVAVRRTGANLPIRVEEVVF